MVNRVDTDKIQAKVKDLPLLQGQGQNLSLSLRANDPNFSRVTYPAVWSFLQRKPHENLKVVEGAI